MSFRSKTEKAKKFGTPSAPSPSAPPKALSPRVTGGTPSAPSPSAPPKALSPRSYGITQTEVGQTIQEQFKTKVQTLTAPIRNTIRTLTTKAEALDKAGGGRTPDLGARATAINVREQIADEQKKIKQIEQEQHNIELQNNVNQIIQALESGNIVAPDYFQNNIAWVKSGAITQQAFLDSYYHLSNQGIIHSPIIEEPIIEEPIIEEPIIELKETWWVIRPSGLIEQVTVTQKFVNTMTAQGWIFSKDKPTIEEPQNQNISIVFYIGKGGDLKTHFGINSIVVTPDEAEQLAGWLYQNYNTKILFVMNRLTDDVRTHTLQQIKDLIIKKLKDDKPDSDDIDDDDIKKPQELGFMGAGVVGAIAGLVLLGFIVDSKVDSTPRGRI